MRNLTVIFKALMLFGLLMVSAFVEAQEPCEITCSAEMPICSGTSITLSVPAVNQQQYYYHWLPGGQTTRSITVRPVRPANDEGPGLYETTYSVEIYDQDSALLCTPSFTVSVKPVFRIKFQQMQQTCSNKDAENGRGRTAQVMTWVDSTAMVYAPPFVYDWYVSLRPYETPLSSLHIAPGNPSLAIGLEAYKYYYLKVTDNRGCTQADSVKLKAYLNPRIEISTDPDSTVYLQNPHVTYSFENQPFQYRFKEDDDAQEMVVDTFVRVSDFIWILNDTYNITSTDDEPRFTYVETGDYSTELKVYNPQGCDTSYYKTVKVEPVKLKIPNVFTPNGDNINDYFIISLDGGNDLGDGNGSGGTRNDDNGTQFEYEGYEPLNRYYESTELTVFNRWGRVVYHSKDYRNDWDGGNLSDGTYFYVLKCHGLKNDATYQGSVMIIKAQRQ